MTRKFCCQDQDPIQGNLFIHENCGPDAVKRYEMFHHFFGFQDPLTTTTKSTNSSIGSATSGRMHGILAQQSLSTSRLAQCRGSQFTKQGVESSSKLEIVFKLMLLQTMVTPLISIFKTGQWTGNRYNSVWVPCMLICFTCLKILATCIIVWTWKTFSTLSSSQLQQLDAKQKCSPKGCWGKVDVEHLLVWFKRRSMGRRLNPLVEQSRQLSSKVSPSSKHHYCFLLWSKAFLHDQ